MILLFLGLLFFLIYDWLGIRERQQNDIHRERNDLTLLPSASPESPGQNRREILTMGFLYLLALLAGLSLITGVGAFSPIKGLSWLFRCLPSFW